jgi:exopolyphosphatase/pppGpp-phosphohydrolase
LLLLMHIGGGSMEIVYGRDEDPAMSMSLPLGAGRLTHSHLRNHPADRRQVKRLRRHVRDVLAPAVQRMATVEQVAACYGVKLGYVYRLACLRRWQRRRDRDRRVRYRAADVDAVLGARRVSKHA